MTILTLLIPPDWPQQRRDCSWLLRDKAGRILRQGHSEPAYWPGIGEGAEDSGELACEILLCGSQCVSMQARLPQKARARTPQVMAAALEEVLLESPEQLMYAALAVDAEGASTIGVISRQRLQDIVRLLRELGYMPRAAWPLGKVLPAGQAWVYAGNLDLAMDGNGFSSFACDQHLATWLAHLPLRSYRTLDRQLPEAVRSLLDSGKNSGDWQELGPDEVVLTLPDGVGFLYGELAAPKARVALARHFRRTGQIALVATLSLALLAGGQWVWLESQASTYRAHVVKRFQQAFPQAALVDPLLQLRRQVDQARREAGQLAEDDFLRLLGPLTSVPANEVALLGEMQYVDGRLQVMGKLNSQALARLAEVCQQQGLQLAQGAVPGSFNIRAGD